MPVCFCDKMESGVYSSVFRYPDFVTLSLAVTLHHDFMFGVRWA